jgi:hypothetical protein
LKTKLIELSLKNLVRTAKKTTVHHYKGHLVNHIKEIIAVFSENHAKPINIFCGQNAELLIIKAGSTYAYHWAFRG